MDPYHRAFSSRLPWNLPENKLSEALGRVRAQGREVLDLTESNPTRAGLDYPQGAILEALSQNDALIYEPHPSGLRAARNAISGYYAARGDPIPPDHILLTASTSEGYSFLFKLLANPGDEILVPRPSYPLFEYLARLESVAVQSYPLRYDGRWWIDLEALGDAVTDRTRAVVVVNPNNPTGNFLSEGERAGLFGLCGRRGLPLVCDEVFGDYSFGARPRTVRAGDVLSFTLSGLSKLVGLPQVKLAWVAVNGPAAVRKDALERLELIADTYLSVGTPVQHAAPKLLALGQAFQARLRARLTENLAELRAATGGRRPCSLLAVEGGWYAVLNLPRTRTEEQWVLEFLEKSGVLVQPGYFYDFDSEAYIVVSLLTPPETLHRGIARILEGLESGT